MASARDKTKRNVSNFSNFKVNRMVIAVKDKYPIDVQKRICRLFSFIATLCKDSKKGFFTNIHWKAFKDIDPEYVGTKELLIKEGLIEVNPSVSYGPKAKNPHTRSYRIENQKYDSGLFWYSFSGNKKPKKPKHPKVSPIKDNTTATGEGIDWQQECFSRLTVDEACFESTGDPKTDRNILSAFQKIKSGAFNASRGKSVGRLYNTIAMMPKEGRSYIRYNGLPLTDNDWKTCHPFLILTICDHSEKSLYNLFVNNSAIDIYSFIPENCGVKWQEYILPFNHKTGRAKHLCQSQEEFRAAMKDEFLRFLNGGKRLTNNVFSNYYKLNFPRTWAIIIAGGKSNAKYFQDLEAKFMDMASDHSAANKLFYLQCHDGFLSTSENSKVITEKLIEVVFNSVGYKPVFKSNVLCNNTITKKATSSFNSSYSNIVALDNPVNNIIIPISTLNSNTNGIKHHNFPTSKNKKDFPPWLLAKIRSSRQKKCAHISLLVQDEPSLDDFDTL